MYVYLLTVGVQLCSPSLGKVIPNNSMIGIDVAKDADAVVLCQSENDDTYGVWRFPNGSDVYFCNEFGQAALCKGNYAEGMYTCIIADNENINHTLYVGLNTNGRFSTAINYINIVTSTVTFVTTNTTATYINCTVNGTIVELNNTQHVIESYEMPISTQVSLKLELEGLYNCLIWNARMVKSKDEVNLVYLSIANFSVYTAGIIYMIPVLSILYI